MQEFIDFNKVEKELAICKSNYEPLNEKLIKEIPQLGDLRVPYLNPSFEAMIKTQLSFNEAGFRQLDSVKTKFPPGADQNIEGRIENVLEKMRELVIVGKDIK